MIIHLIVSPPFIDNRKNSHHGKGVEEDIEIHNNQLALQIPLDLIQQSSSRFQFKKKSLKYTALSQALFSNQH